MRTLLAALALVTLAACARAKVTEWRDRDFTVCMNAFCDGDCLNNKVQEVCPKPAKAKMVGGSSVSRASSVDRYGNIQYSNQNCVTYRCSDDIYPQ